MMLALLWVALGGGLGSVSRFGLSQWVVRITDKSFPYGILVVNVLGCLVIGILIAFFQKQRVLDHFLTPHLQNFLIIGFLGGFTTFSSFSLEALWLFQKGECLKAVVYIIASVVISMLAVFLGFTLVARY